MTVARWRKSSRSQNTSNCVEVANTLGAVRDSKNYNGSVLGGNVAALVSAVKNGQFTR